VPGFARASFQDYVSVFAFCFVFILFSVFFAGCGSDQPFIAEKVKFRVNFTQETIQVSFELNPDYQVKIQKTILYPDLGHVFIDWTEGLGRNELGSFLKADPSSLEKPWPVSEIIQFPNTSSLPTSVPSGRALKQWALSDDRLRVSLLYAASPKLIAGGAILSDQFHAVPKNFLATQEFHAANGDVEATVSFAGPTKDSYGGLYFLGNFGVMPFTRTALKSKLLSQREYFFITAENSEELSWEILADRPVSIVRPGNFWFKFFSVSELIANLILDLESFTGGR